MPKVPEKGKLQNMLNIFLRKGKIKEIKIYPSLPYMNEERKQRRKKK